MSLSGVPFAEGKGISRKGQDIQLSPANQKFSLHLCLSKLPISFRSWTLPTCPTTCPLSMSLNVLVAVTVPSLQRKPFTRLPQFIRRLLKVADMEDRTLIHIHCASSSCSSILSLTFRNGHEGPFIAPSAHRHFPGSFCDALTGKFVSNPKA
ncbi:hypothetical protein Agabi119p4_5017 [Agaricus bisporus var. burnettii]|uniref:Uncharacterized protein n=1 Tax=Agaricus bisporus var. burnettii TaxID=192524 RepID=A0A8H7KHH3_AGABI|nr:hypothetical protein Agabi119p4_5017 [Agaricus bisporus var. burnettii]